MANIRNTKLTNYECAGFIFNSNFDSGNLGRVELVRCASDLNDKINNGNSVVPLSLTSAINTTTTTANTSATSSVTSSSLPVTPPSSSESTAPTPIPSINNSKEKQVDVEFNLWTRPDCYGTPFENQNRTWFYFSIRGGEKNQLIKFNVLNLNKQAKLFSQGMHPVIKHGSNGKWDRVKDKPVFYLTDESFVLSFFHRTLENIEDNLTFYAFTYPFTYTEQQENLELYDRRYEKGPEELDIIVKEMNAPRKDKLVIKINDKINFDQDFKGGVGTEDFSMEDENFGSNLMSIKTEKELLDVMTENANDEMKFRDFQKSKDIFKVNTSSVIDENTSESMQQITSLVNNVKIEKSSLETVKAFMSHDIRTRLDEVKDDIYYYRELLINSYEDRRVDLVTISNFHGIEEKREDRMKNLFPDQSKLRCHSFRDKKVIFISSRVHPGETPASFVLNGFLNLLLDRKSQVANLLRKMYVFKIVPFLNPDGVYNGLYRSDTLGHNLNRVYLNPRLDTQPSIYAARKLIRFYHFGFDKIDNIDELGEPAGVGEAEISLLLNRHPCSHDLLHDDLPGKIETIQPTPLVEVTVNSLIDANEELPPIDTSATFDVADEGIKNPIIKALAAKMLPILDDQNKTQSELNNASLKRSHTSLNIFDQTATNVLKLFSAKNWTETFFNRIFRKKFLTLPIADVDVRSYISEENYLRHQLQQQDYIGLPAIDMQKLVHVDIDKFENLLMTSRHSIYHHHHQHLPGIKSTNDVEMCDRQQINDTESKSTEKDQKSLKPGTTSVHSALDVKLLPIQRRCVTQPQSKSSQKLENIDKKVLPKINKTGTGHNKLKETANNVKNLVVKDKKGTEKAGSSVNVTTTTKVRSNPILHSNSSNRSHQHHHYKHYISHYNADKQQKVLQQQYFSQQPHQGLNISLDFRVTTDEKGEKCIVEEKSNLFLYLDLHGHASKKGVFMYGNHLPNSHEAVECMLLPRLMSMNCHHFHFDACNFSERNMYLKGKRDGLSKEGSGRVAIYKSTGLIKSYTLESNYNMPKCVNILPPKGKEQSCKILNLIPPKFSPAIFEEVGRALGPSLLDLTNSNPCSRLINSEFRTLQGMRNALKNEISRGVSKARVSKFTKTKNKRNSTSTSVSLPSSSSSSTEPKDVPKENKVYNLQPSSSSSHPQQLLKSSASLNKNVSVVQQSSGVGNKVLGLKMKHQAKIPSFVRKDVGALTTKKKKILCETSASSSISAQPVASVLNQHQVPRKKIKVSNASTAQPYLAQTKGDSVNTTAILTASCSVTSSTNLPTELANFFLNTEFNDSTDAPCCSKTMSYQKPSSPSSSCSTSSNGQLKITSFMPIKKHTKSKKMKFSKTTTTTKKLGLKKQSKKLTATKTIALSSGGGSGGVGGGNGGVTSSEVVVDDVTQINVNIVSASSIPTSNNTLIANAGTSSTSKLLKKKKRTLKSETNLKRKKSRCCNKPLLH